MKPCNISNLKGFEAFSNYIIYPNGDVYSLKNQKFLKGCIDTKGYRYIDVRANGKRRCPKVHRLVGLAFIENTLNKPQLNHIDGDKLNNCHSNLEWVTNGENQIHAYALGLNRASKGKDNYQWDGKHKNCKKVRQLSLSGETLGEFDSIAQAGRKVGKSYSKISGVCRGKGQTAYGYKWEYID